VLQLYRPFCVAIMYFMVCIVSDNFMFAFGSESELYGVFCHYSHFMFQHNYAVLMLKSVNDTLYSRFVKVIRNHLVFGTSYYLFLDPEGRSQNATLCPTCFLGISYLKIPNAFLVYSGAQRNFEYTFLLTFPTDLPSQILKLVSN